MATQLEYHLNTYQFESKATVVSVTSQGPNGATVILDQTIFYPQGGGQPSDIGNIQGPTGAIFRVKKSTLNQTTSQVEHLGSFEPQDATFVSGDLVVLAVDQPTRILHARLHSAGHLLDVAVNNAKLGKLEPGKGCHFPTGAYVEYVGSPSDESLKANAKELIQQNINALLAAGSAVQVQLSSYDGIAALCGSIPSYITDKSKEYRIVSMAGLACPCGGTHVKNTQDIGKLVVTGVKFPKGKMRVSYEVK